MKITAWGAFWAVCTVLAISDHIAYAIKGQKQAELEHELKVREALDRIRNGECLVALTSIEREAMKRHVSNYSTNN